MKTSDEFFSTNIFDSKQAEENKKKIEAVQKEINDQMKERSYMTGADAWKKPEEELECEVKLGKIPDPVKEEIFATCLNFLHTHTEDELYEIVRLAFDAAEVFGY